MLPLKSYTQERHGCSSKRRPQKIGGLGRKKFAESLEWTAAKAAEPDRGGWLVKNARVIAEILRAEHGVDPGKAVSLAVCQANADGLGLGLQALKVGEPVFDQDGVALIRAKQATAFDLACSAVNAVYVKRPSLDPSKSFRIFAWVITVSLGRSWPGPWSASPHPE